MDASDIPQLFECLRAALGTDQDVRKVAESALQASEGRPGFCSCLAARFEAVAAHFEAVARSCLAYLQRRAQAFALSCRKFCQAKKRIIVPDGWQQCTSKTPASGIGGLAWASGMPVFLYRVLLIYDTAC